MQTFLAYPDFDKSASVLDNTRLGNQCYRECLTLLRGGWQHHPASKMWRGYEYALCNYSLALVQEMEKRKRWKQSVIDRWRNYYTEYRAKLVNTGLPPWVGNEQFHASHRSNLLRKDPVYYGQFNWKEDPTMEYVWPTN